MRSVAPRVPCAIGTAAAVTYASRMDANDTVVVKVVGSGPEADIVCGLLRSAGLECSYRDTDAIDSVLEDFTPSGPREILVLKSDLETAKAVLAEAGH
jgi:hypothetical protein